MPSNGPTAKCYPTEEQYTEWKDRADEMGMSVSQWIQNMAEAGHKKFDADVEPDDTRLELREQRNQYKRDLEEARDRINVLEDRLVDTEHRAIREYIEKNPGCTWDEVVQKLVDTTDERALRHLDAMEGDSIRRDEDDRFYSMEDQ